MKDSKASIKRAEIIQKGSRLFAKKGYHATTIGDIAKQLGVTKPALYYYIGAKEDIIEEIGKKTLVRMATIIKSGKSSKPPREKLHALIRYLVSYAAENWEVASVLFDQTDAIPARTRKIVKRKKKQVEQVLQQILIDGVEQGDFIIKDIKLTSFAILGICNWTYHWYHADGKQTPSQIADEFIKLVENALSLNSKSK